MSIYIISDLHLKQSEIAVFDQLSKFLAEISNYQNTLYILGDFFEYWIGDDDKDPFYQKIIKQLNYAIAKGLTIKFMHGNRDFLIGKKFALKSSVTLIDDPYYLNWNNQKILLTHGDLLCTDDKSYLRYRSFVQSSVVKWLFLHLPLSIRYKIAKKIRYKSQNRPRYEIDFNATDLGLKRYAADCNIVIHGHTHKLNIHQHPNLKLTRYVLGDWHKHQFSYIKIDHDITLYESGVAKNA